MAAPLGSGLQGSVAWRAHPPDPMPLRPRTLAVVATALMLAACGPLPLSSPQDAAAPADPADAPARCAALGAFSAAATRISRADWIDAAQLHAVDPGTGQRVGAPLPAHCRVQGLLDERIGSDGEPYRTAFELRLPAAGNGRLLHQGGSGIDGVLPMAVGRNTGALGWADNGLQRGFAAVASDGGHAAPRPHFGLNARAREDHAWRAHERTARTARALFARFYGVPPRHAYFVGCGGGGRQGMMFTQRFPELYDGVVAVAPAMRQAQGELLSAAWSLQQWLGVAPAAADGRPRLSAALSDRQLERVAAEIVDRCDAADDLVDGLVADTALCRLRPQRLLCPAAGEGCLSREQVDALARVMAGPTSRDGVQLHPGFPWDPGIAAAPWRRWMLGSDDDDGGRGGARILLRSHALGLVHATPPDATLTLGSFDFERDPLRLAASHRLYGTADDVLLKAFQRRGGKLLLVHGMADPVVSALQTIDYQQRADAAHGAAVAARFVRSFLVPGMNHCEGGPATDAFDALAAIVDWVEQGRAPERIVAQGTSMRPGLARPLCPYPRIARYKGGDPAAAASFECR